VSKAIILFIALLSLTLIVCNKKSTPTVSVIKATDDTGRIIELPHPARRIILMTGSPVDLLFTLGAGDHIIGVTDNFSSSYPETVRKFESLRNLPSIGSRSAPNIEAMLELKPDLILVSGSSNNPEKNASALKKAGLPFAVMKSFETIDDAIKQIENLSVFLGKAEEGKIIASQLKNSLNGYKIISTLFSSKKPDVFFWWGSDNGTYGRNTALSELIALSGSNNISDSAGKGFFQISPEYVIQKNPDFIFYSYWKEHDKDLRKKQLEEIPGFSSLAAVKNKRVYAIDGHCLHSALLFPRTLDSIISWTHPRLSNSNESLAMNNQSTYFDDCDRTVTVPSDPKRIVSVATGDIEIIYAIGAESKLCGVPDGVKYPPQVVSIPKIGGMYGRFSPEKIVGVNPDLILMTMSAWAQYRKHLDQLEQNKQTVLGLIYPRTFEETMGHILRLGILCGSLNKANLLVDSLRNRKNSILDKTIKIDWNKRPSVYMEWINIEGGRGSTYGKTERNHEIIELAGGINIFRDKDTPSFIANDEDILSRNPDVIIVSVDSTRYPSRDIISSVRSRSGWEHISAVKNNRIYIIDSQTTWANPRLIKSIERIAMLLHPELFK
jgi:iron complex transport system substrate-binding protein